MGPYPYSRTTCFSLLTAYNLPPTHYSKATLDAMVLDAEAGGYPLLCPQTKLPIEGAACP